MLRSFAFLALGLFGIVLIGCEPVPPAAPPKAPAKDAHAHDDHEHGDHAHDDHDHKDGDHKHDDHADEAAPKTYAEAIEKIETLRKSIKDNFDADKLKEADTAVHEVGHILESVVKLSAKESLSPEDTETVKKSVETLFDQFGKIDDKLHGGMGSTYNDVAKEIEAAIAALQSKVKAK